MRRCNGRGLGCLRPSFGCGVDGQVKFRQTNIDAVVRLSVLAGLLGRLELDAFDSVVALEEQLGVFAPFFACGLGLANVDRALDRKSTRLNSSTNAHLVCRLLLEKNNTNYNNNTTTTYH